MNTDFAIKLAEGEVKHSKLNNFARQQFEALAKDYPDAMGLRNKTDVLELIDTFSSQQPQKVSQFLKRIFKNEVSTNKTIQAFIDLATGILSTSSPKFQRLSRTITNNAQTLLKVFEKQDHSNNTGRMTLNMFNLLSHFKKL